MSNTQGQDTKSVAIQGLREQTRLPEALAPVTGRWNTLSPGVRGTQAHWAPEQYQNQDLSKLLPENKNERQGALSSSSCQTDSGHQQCLGLSGAGKDTCLSRCVLPQLQLPKSTALAQMEVTERGQ